MYREALIAYFVLVLSIFTAGFILGGCSFYYKSLHKEVLQCQKGTLECLDTDHVDVEEDDADVKNK